jgi:hypothetical protein
MLYVVKHYSACTAAQDSESTSKRLLNNSWAISHDCLARLCNCSWYKIAHMTPDTTTCGACGKRFVFTSYKDRCPVCCPVQKKDEDSPGEYDQTDFSDLTEESRE